MFAVYVYQPVHSLVFCHGEDSRPRAACMVAVLGDMPVCMTCPKHYNFAVNLKSGAEIHLCLVDLLQSKPDLHLPKCYFAI